MEFTNSYSSLNSEHGETAVVEGSSATTRLGDMMLQSGLTVAGFVVGNILVEAIKYKWFSQREKGVDLAKFKNVRITCMVPTKDLEAFSEDFSVARADAERIQEGEG